MTAYSVLRFLLDILQQFIHMQIVCTFVCLCIRPYHFCCSSHCRQEQQLETMDLRTLYPLCVSFYVLKMLQLNTICWFQFKEILIMQYIVIFNHGLWMRLNSIIRIACKSENSIYAVILYIPHTRRSVQRISLLFTMRCIQQYWSEWKRKSYSIYGAWNTDNITNTAGN